MEELKRGKMELIRAGVNAYEEGDCSWSEGNSRHPQCCTEYFYTVCRPPRAVAVCQA